MKIKNLNAAKKLVEKYRSVTLEQINEKWDSLNFRPAYEAANALTGFGASHTCSLCKGVFKPYPYDSCEGCLYGSNHLSCIGSPHRKGWMAISEAETPEDLLAALHARADYIEGLIEKL